MKKISVLILLSVALLAGCSKSDPGGCPYGDVTTVAPAAEVTAVEQYLTSAGITGAIKHPSGMYYKITTPGTGNSAGQCSSIGILYKGMLTNGTVFDQTTNNQTRVFTLGQLIAGWRIGIPLIKQGGKITLYIPPTLGYGPTASGPIPANSILVFDVELVALG